jgi:hypothetical protein
MSNEHQKPKVIKIDASDKLAEASDKLAEALANLMSKRVHPVEEMQQALFHSLIPLIDVVRMVGTGQTEIADKSLRGKVISFAVSEAYDNEAMNGILGNKTLSFEGDGFQLRLQIAFDKEVFLEKHKFAVSDNDGNVLGNVELKDIKTDCDCESCKLRVMSYKQAQVDGEMQDERNLLRKKSKGNNPSFPSFQTGEA